MGCRHIALEAGMIGENVGRWKQYTYRARLGHSMRETYYTGSIILPFRCPVSAKTSAIMYKMSIAIKASSVSVAERCINMQWILIKAIPRTHASLSLFMEPVMWNWGIYYGKHYQE